MATDQVVHYQSHTAPTKGVCGAGRFGRRDPNVHVTRTEHEVTCSRCVEWLSDVTDALAREAPGVSTP